MTERDPSDSAILDTRFPGYSWMPRWTRKYWTPKTALTLGLAIFSAGSWVGTYLTRPDVSSLTKDLGVLSRAVGEIQIAMGPECIRNCVLRTGDIAELKTHVDDLWSMRIDINAELARQQLAKQKKEDERRPIQNPPKKKTNK